MNTAEKKASPATAATISGQLAQFAANLHYDDLPLDVRSRAHLVLLDTLGCALTGSQTEELQLIRRAICAAAGGVGDAELWGTSDRAPLPLAALANGAAIHAREMDDFEGCLHSGSVIVPAALGTAAQVRASGRELLTAIVIGYDIARRVLEGAGGNRPFKKRGWHSTSTCGGFGAAAAVAHLLKLNAEQVQWALGYAGSNAGGTWAFIADGAMSKRIHPGFAAQTGVIAAYLAANGVTGPTSIFEAEWGGFFPTYVGDDAKPEKTVKDLGTDFKIRIVGVKPYAACRGNHSSIDAILDLRKELNIRPETVAKVTVRGSRTHVKQLGKQDVKTMLDAQFSLPYNIAVALATGGAMIDQYTTQALRRPEILALARRVDVVADERVPDGEQPFVEVELNDGRVVTRQVLIARGDHRNPLSEDEQRAKFRITAGQALPQDEVTRLEHALAHVAEMSDVRELTELLVVKRGTARVRASAG